MSALGPYTNIQKIITLLWVVWIFSFIFFFSDLRVVLKCNREGAKKKDVVQIVSKQIHCRVQPLPLFFNLSSFTTSQYLLDQTWERERERGTCWSVCRVRQGSILAFCKRGSHTSPIDFVFQSKVFHTFFSCFIFIGWVWVFLLVRWLENVALYWPNNAIKCNILIPKDSCILCKLQFLIATTIIIIIKKYFF